MPGNLRVYIDIFLTERLRGGEIGRIIKGFNITVFNIAVSHGEDQNPG